MVALRPTIEIRCICALEGILGGDKRGRCRSWAGGGRGGFDCSCLAPRSAGVAKVRQWFLWAKGRGTERPAGLAYHALVLGTTTCGALALGTTTCGR